MAKTTTFKSLAVALLLALGIQVSYAQTFWTETFSNETTASANWVHGGTNAGANNLTWDWTDDLDAGAYNGPTTSLPTGSTGYFWFDSDGNDVGAHDVTLSGTGNPANCTGKTGVHLKFYTFFRTYTGTDLGRIGISTNGGASYTYHNVPQFDALPPEGVFEGLLDIAIPEADNQASVIVQFRWAGDFEYYWKVDDLELTSAGGPVPCSANPMAVFCDDFETYSLGNISPQSNHWIPWNLSDIPSNNISSDVVASPTSNGIRSMRVRLDGAGDDQLLQLGDKSTGRYELKWKYYIPTGKATYFNIQITENVPQPAPPAANFATEVYFRATGVVDQVDPAPTVSGTFPFDTWFPVKIIVDLDNNIAKLFVNGNLLRSWTYPDNFGAIDFYAADATYLAYVDEVEYVALPPIVYNVDLCGGAIDLTNYFGQPLAQTTGIYDNTTATVSPTDPGVSCWLEADPGADILNSTMWYTFIGDGKKYHIETVPCNATNYIGVAQDDPGDTQMLVYSGPDCNTLTEVACNDDLSFAQFADWRSGVDLETVGGQNYYMLIDGFEFGGVLATGEFCIEISVLPSIPCAAGAVGTYELSSPLLCWEASVSGLVTIDPAGFILPNEGIISGFCWAVSLAPLDPAIYPADQVPNNYLGSSPVSPAPYLPGDVNNGGFLMAGNTYYYTPVVVGNGDNGGLPGYLHNIDITNGCFFVGESQPVLFLPLTNDVTATTVVGAGSVDLTPGGGIGELIGAEDFYTYLWSNGATTQDLSGVAAGTYTCVVSDPCSESATVTATVTISSTKDPASIQSFVLSPNPTSGIVTLDLALAAAADVRIEVLNTLGQTLQTINVGKLSNLSQKVDLNNMAQGSYFLRVTVDGETALRRVVVQR